ncbi:MAG TPA: sialidase family protein [Bacteroidales bacterium]|nr:sialidase family protein [Bacteroidales bacterium]
MRGILLMLWISLACYNLANAQHYTSGGIDMEIRMISDSADHNAFPDLIRYKKYFYCAIREADTHEPRENNLYGKIRVIRSKKGDKWETVISFEIPKYDMRDGKFVILPDGRLMMYFGCSEYKNGRLISRLTHVSYSSDGVHFTPPRPVEIDPAIKTHFDWVWSITWYDTVGYANLYQIKGKGGKWNVYLMKTNDGLHYSPITSWDLGPRPNEARIRFAPDGRMIVIVRRESGGPGILGMSYPPFTEWEWYDMSIKLGGPNFLVLSNNKILIGSRLFKSKEVGEQMGKVNEDYRTGIFIASDMGEIRKVVELPSDGDTSYPGMIIYKDYLYVAYYSSHEGKAKIYFAKILFSDIESLFD